MILFSIVFLFFGLGGLQTQVKGTHRWITIGPLEFSNFEMAKVFSMIYLARVLSFHKINYRSMIPVVAVFLLMLVIDKGSSIGIITLLIVISIFMFVARINPRISAFLLICLLFVFLFAFSIPLYQQNQQRGGIFGVGIGESSYKRDLQLEAFTDLIFPIICEELGLIGSIVVIVLFLFCAFAIVGVALKTSDVFGRLLLFGITGIISLQAFQNIAMSLGVFSIKGASLPFISYGNFQLLANWFLIGTVLNIIRRQGLGFLDWNRKRTLSSWVQYSG